MSENDLKTAESKVTYENNSLFEDFKRKEFLGSLFPNFIGLKWIKHKNYIETKIDYLKKQIESEQIDEILRG